MPGGFELAEAIERGPAAAGVESVAGAEGISKTCRAHGLSLSGPPNRRIVTKRRSLADWRRVCLPALSGTARAQVTCLKGPILD